MERPLYASSAATKLAKREKINPKEGRKEKLHRHTAKHTSSQNRQQQEEPQVLEEVLEKAIGKHGEKPSEKIRRRDDYKQYVPERMPCVRARTR